MTKNKMDLQKLAHELDGSLGSIGVATETIADISTELLQLVDKMNNLPDEQHLRIYFHEWHRSLRVLSKLMYHASNDLVAGNEKARAVSENMFDEIHGNEKKPLHSAK